MERAVEKRIRREDATLTEFGAQLEPALRVEPGETFLVETQDNFFGKIDSEEVLPTAEQLPFLRHQFWKVNPVAGPIHVEGCKAGDLLVLEIEDIIPSERGWTGFAPDFGNLAGNAAFPELQQPYSRITHHHPGPSGATSDGTGTFNVNREVAYPLRP
nr:acetamidase/formamidase family protein [Actinomycetota bacterium]